MSVVTCGVTEILVAIGDSYWRCVSCHLHFSKFTSIDEHVRQKHGHSSNGPELPASDPMRRSKVCSISLETSPSSTLSAVPAVVKINLDDPGADHRPDIGPASEQNVTAVSDSFKPSENVQRSKSSQLKNQNPCDKNASEKGVVRASKTSQLNTFERESVSPFTETSSLASHVVIDTSGETQTVVKPKGHQPEECEEIEDLEEDGNVSKAMLASMLSFLEKSLEMDDISSVFQNWESLSPEFFEQQLLNHSDLSDNLADGIEDTLGNPAGDDGNGNFVPTQSPLPSSSKLVGTFVSHRGNKKAILDNGFEETVKDISTSDEPIFCPQVESQSVRINAVDENSVNSVIENSSEFDDVELDETVYEDIRMDLGEEENNSNDHPMEAKDPAALKAVKSFMKFSSTQSKIFDLMSSLLFVETSSTFPEENSGNDCASVVADEESVKKKIVDMSNRSLDKSHESSQVCSQASPFSSVPSSSQRVKFTHSDHKACAEDRLSTTRTSARKVKDSLALTNKSCELSTICSSHSKNSTQGEAVADVACLLNKISETQAEVNADSLNNCSPFKKTSNSKNRERELRAKRSSSLTGNNEEVADTHHEKDTNENDSAIKSNGTVKPSSSASVMRTRKKGATESKMVESRNAVHDAISEMLKRNQRKEHKDLLSRTHLVEQNKSKKVQQNTTDQRAFLSSNHNFKDKAKTDIKDSRRTLKNPSGLSLMQYIAQHSVTRKTNMSNHTQIQEGDTAMSAMPSQEQKMRHICTICDASFSTIGALQRHMKVNFTLSKPCKCKVCHKKFHCLSVLSVHVYKCHERLGNPMCLICYVKCSNTKYLLQHVRKHQKAEAEKSRRYKQELFALPKDRIKSKFWRCNKCNALIPNKKHIIKSHVCTIDKTCKECNIEFPTLITYKLHMASHTGRMYECDICGEHFKDIVSRNTHRLTHDCVKGNFLCQVCGAQFAQRHQLAKHVKIHSKDRKARPTLTCTECNKVYKCRKSFQRHMNVTHLGVKDYQFKCPYCQHQYFTSWQLREHVAWHHFGEKPHHCRYCGKGFVCRPTLIRHERYEHTGSKPYKCRYCPEAFVEKKLLDTHEAKKHTHVFPYKCDVCGKGFVQRSLLRSHALTHSKHKPHQCHLCGACFSKLCHLKRHTPSCLKKNCDAAGEATVKAPLSSSEPAVNSVSLPSPEAHGVDASEAEVKAGAQAEEVDATENILSPQLTTDTGVAGLDSLVGVPDELQD